MTLLAPLWMEKLGYSAMNDRQALDLIMNPGVASSSDLLCAAGTGFTSTIAAGRAAVEGNSQTQQGIYVVQNTNSVSVVHTNPNATNPRIDQLGVKVNDSTDGGDLTDGSEALALTGVPTAGATLADQKGKAALPKNFLVLCSVLVPAAAPSASAFEYEDRRVLAMGYERKQGLLSERPAAGIKGREYFATDAKTYSIDTGSEWQEILTATPEYILTLGVKVEAGGVAPSVVGEKGKGNLGGNPKIKAGQTLTAGETIATIPPNVRPTKPIEFTVSGINVKISTAGIMTAATTLNEGQKIEWSGHGYSFT